MQPGQQGEGVWDRPAGQGARRPVVVKSGWRCELSKSNEPKLSLAPRVLSFEPFWKWLQGHPNCIVSAGTPDVVLYDHDDYHWHFGVDGEDGTLLVQLIRGKNLVGELLLDGRSVSYVQIEQKGEEEFLYDCIEEDESGAVVAYTFTLSHDYDPEETAAQKGRFVH